MRLFSLIVCLCIVYARAYTRSLFQVNGAEDLPSAQCPSSPNDRQLELGEVSAACNPEDDDYCAKCSCALFTAFKPELRAAGLFELPDGEADQEALMQAVTEGAAVITQCIQDFIPQFLANGIPIQALASLADCTFAGGSAPQCLVNRVSEEIPEEVGPGVTGGTSGPQGKPGNSGSSSSSSSSSSGGGGPSGSGSKEEESNNQSKGSADEFAEDTPQDVEDDVKDAVGGSNAPEKEDAAQGPDGANKSGNEENSNEGTAIGGDGTPVTPPESSNGPANSSPPNGSTGGSGSTPSPADNSGGSARSPSPGGGSEASPNPSGAGGKGKDGEGTSPPPSSSDGSSSAMSLSLLALSAAAAALLLAC